MKSLLLTFLIVSSLCSMRYVDEEIMKKHHHEQYPKDGPNITVHLIPHSHDDVGFVKTVDDYYYGDDMKTQIAGVQYTIDTVITQLTEHPEYRFVIVEMAFLYRWWRKATDKDKSRLKALVANKQLQFINAGWCMSDEANMYYEDFIDQMTVGLRWLKQTFNYVPDVAWHIDPFGHHASTASLFSRMGFNSIFFGRIDYQDKEARLRDKRMEMVWRPYQYTADKNTYIFTHIDYVLYSPPPGFCFDIACRAYNEPIKDDPNLNDYNLETKGQQFASYFKSQALHYRTTTLMHTIGGDFHYSSAQMWFKNVNKLMKYINSKPELGVKLIYSTPGNYIEVLQKEMKSYPTKTDDFLPYADQPHASWTGFYTSRPALKNLVKDFSRFIQVAKKHIAELKMADTSYYVRDNGQTIEAGLFALQGALGILQHHDGVSGTSRQKVADNYRSTAFKSIASFKEIYSNIKKEEILRQTEDKVSDLNINLFWNETGEATGLSNWINEGKIVLVSFYNPGSKGTYPVRLRVPPKDLNIFNQDNSLIPGDVVCANLRDTSDCELLFNLDIEESNNAYVKLSASIAGSARQVRVKELTLVEQIKEFTLGNDKLKFTRGNQSFDLTINGKHETFKIFYNYYQGADNNDDQNSGVYVFRPKTNSAQPYSTISKMYYADGVTTGIIVLDGSHTLTKVYFSKTVDYVRNFGFTVESHLDSIPIADGIGKEVTFNLQTGINGNRTFYTDSMGLEEQKRILNQRPSWNYTVFEPIASNFYPVNSFIRLQDVNSQDRMVAILSDRSQGGTVLNQGEIELMVHRRLLVDDARGVGEPLNQTDPDGQGLRQTVRHYVLFNSKKYRTVQKWNDQRILPVFGTVTSDKFGFIATQPAPLIVPETVKLYLRPFIDGSYLLRLHNMDPSASTSVTFGSEWKTTQLALAGNQLQSEWTSKQLKWNQEASLPETVINKINDIVTDISENVSPKTKSLYLSKEGITTIDLKPFEIRTFKLTK